MTTQFQCLIKIKVSIADSEIFKFSGQQTWLDGKEKKKVKHNCNLSFPGLFYSVMNMTVNVCKYECFFMFCPQHLLGGVSSHLFDNKYLQCMFIAWPAS